MKTIVISTDVFAAIWKLRIEGEESEDAILGRVLDVMPSPTKVPDALGGGRMGGFYDERSGVHFFEGMRIFRTYKGHKREAIATRDVWHVEATGQSFHSLHKLSQSVNDGKHENAWQNWKYRDEETGEDRFIDHLRQLKQQGGK
jgi:hypothetical protein